MQAWARTSERYGEVCMESGRSLASGMRNKTRELLFIHLLNSLMIVPINSRIILLVPVLHENPQGTSEGGGREGVQSHTRIQNANSNIDTRPD